MSKHLHVGDEVFVHSGNHKGSSGKLLKKMGEKALIEGVNLVKRHMKPTQDRKGGIVTKEAPIHVSNIAFKHEDKPAKLRAKFDGETKVIYVKVGKDEKVIRQSKKAVKK
ncbi:MAG: 50S ribosomal protein L24 [Chlamydiia bacterium]|nr:50S ribosomal protein L24 [Chlamydiia bacterium]